MMTRICVWVAVLGVGASLACNDRGTPPPEFNTTITTSDGTTLLPIRVAKHDKASLTGGAASTETPAGAAGGAATASTAGAVPIDDSTPEALANTLVKIVEAGSITQIPDILVPEQKEAAQQVLGAFQPVLEAQAELKKALDEKFPGHAIKLPNAGSMPGGMPQEITITDIKTIDDDNAEGTIHSKAASGEEKTEPIKFKRVEGKWRLGDSDLSKLPPPDQLQKITDAMNKLAEAMRSVAKKVTDGEIADEKAAGEELGKAAMGAAMGMMGGPGTPAPDAGGDKPADKPAEKPKEVKPAPPRRTRRGAGQPDPLDGTVPLPGVLPRG
jgi:hypothetical protein